MMMDYIFSVDSMKSVSAAPYRLIINYTLSFSFLSSFIHSSWQLVVLLCSCFWECLHFTSPFKELCLELLADQSVFQSIPFHLSESPQILSDSLWVDWNYRNTLEDLFWRGQVYSGAHIARRQLPDISRRNSDLVAQRYTTTLVWKG